jgi:leucyl/phenylalanyl-tRNA---protein transferase
MLRSQASAPFGLETVGDRPFIFHETPFQALERWVLGLAWAVKPQRIGGLPALGRMWLSDLVSPSPGLPDPEGALDRPAGLAGIVHDLSVPTLVEAYRRSLYPFAHIAPVKWWSPPQRCVLYFDEFHVGRRLRRLMRQDRYAVTFDRDFEGVIAACAGWRECKWHVTWITPQIMHAYAGLYDAGHVHSFEVWNEAGALVGGGYGVALGGVFFTESQFSREPNTSKLGFTVLNWHLAKWGYRLNDGKGATPTILNMGFRLISRRRFLDELAGATRAGGKEGRWRVEDDLKTVVTWEPGLGVIADAACKAPSGEIRRSSGASPC